MPEVETVSLICKFMGGGVGMGGSDGCGEQMEKAQGKCNGFKELKEIVLLESLHQKQAASDEGK